MQIIFSGSLGLLRSFRLILKIEFCLPVLGGVAGLHISVLVMNRLNTTESAILIYQAVLLAFKGSNYLELIYFQMAPFNALSIVYLACKPILCVNTAQHMHAEVYWPKVQLAVPNIKMAGG